MDHRLMVEIRQCISKRELNENCIILQISVVLITLHAIFKITLDIYLYFYYSMAESLFIPLL